MNKTVTVNIGGMVFHIEEHAYASLKKYLDAIRGHFTMSDGRDEIIQDIEGRIAEIFQQRLGTSRQVITEEDVNASMDIMGKPEDFGGSADNGSSSSNYSSTTANPNPLKRKLYRDADDRVIAGVCSGLAHRLGIDAVWIRLLFVAVFFAGGSGFLVYIILAVVLPKAITSTQKLEMRGEDVNISNIRRETEAGGEKKDPSFISNFFDALGQILRAIFKFIIYFIGFIFAIVALCLIFAFVVGIMAMLGVGGITIPLVISDQFLSQGQQLWAMVSLFLLLGVPLIWVLYQLIKWMFRIQHSSRPLNIIVGCLFLLGIITAFFTSINVAREFTQDGKIRNTIDLVSPTTDTMYVKLMDDDKYDEDNRRIIQHGGPFSVTTGTDFVFRQDNVSFDVQKSPGDKFELVQIVTANGTTEKIAMENARDVVYNFEQKDSLLMFSDHFPIPKGSKFRDQKVKLILKVPVGKSVYLDESMEDIIYDIENTTNTYDGNMGGHIWKMTEAGLLCTDHDFSKKEKDNDWNDDNVEINIDKDGVRINGKDTDSMNKDPKDVDIKINEHGVHIKSKNK